MRWSLTGGCRLLLGVIVMLAPTVAGSSPVGAAPPRPDGGGAFVACAGGGGGPMLTAEPGLRDVLDARGWLVGHRLDLPGSSTAPIGLGRVAFLDGPIGGRWIVGEQVGRSARLRVLDGTRGCVESQLEVSGLVLSATLDPSRDVIVHDLIDPDTRQESGVWRRSIAPGGPAPVRLLPGISASDVVAPVWVNAFAWGPTGELAAQSCGAAQCVTRVVDSAGGVTTYRDPDQGVLVGLTGTRLMTQDGFCHVEPCPALAFLRSGGARLSAADAPRVDPRPVPESDPATWEQDELLPYKWSSSAPSASMKAAINAAAADVNATRESRGARFAYSATADDTIGLVSDMSGTCSRALACATRDFGRWWYIRLRPQGTEFDWGTLRWCQSYDNPPSGCFDVERVMVHEFGHVEGLAHPDDYGFRLGPLETVMSPIIPEKGDAGWQMHRFGPCDVARLQRRYDLQTESAPLALCDRVDARLTLELSRTSVGAYQPITVTATLRIRDVPAYDRLGNDRLSGRDVIIERRTEGSGQWVSYDPNPGSSPGTYVISIRPAKSTDFRATFARPADEGLNGDVSSVVSVTVGPCTGSCPESRGRLMAGQE